MQPLQEQFNAERENWAWNRKRVLLSIVSTLIISSGIFRGFEMAENLEDVGIKSIFFNIQKLITILC